MTEVTVPTPPPARGHGLGIGDALEAGWDHINHVFSGHRQPGVLPDTHDQPHSLPAPIAAAVAAQARTETITQEEPVSLGTDLEAFTARVKAVDEDVIAMAEKFAATREGKLLMAAAHGILLAEDPALAATATTIVTALVPQGVANDHPAEAAQGGAA